MVSCPICERPVKEVDINRHIDSECQLHLDDPDAPNAPPAATQTQTQTQTQPWRSKAAAYFKSTTKKAASLRDGGSSVASSPLANGDGPHRQSQIWPGPVPAPVNGVKRTVETRDGVADGDVAAEREEPKSKRIKNAHAPLAERMRPQSLDEVAGQELVGPDGVLRNLIVSDRVPSMILWGGPGTGKTTIARLIARTAGTRFVEINSTSSGVAECKRLFQEAKNELGLTGRKTMIFCDEIHRFSKSQQDVFLGPVEAGHVTLVGATTENPSFKVVNALLSRCRTFTLAKLSDEDVLGILQRALAHETPHPPTPGPSPVEDSDESSPDDRVSGLNLLAEDDHALLRYLAAFADGDARTGLNLLEIALDLCRRPGTTVEDVKKSLTQTLVYDRAGDQHYDTISAFHKSVRGSDPDAALYYLARMLQSGEDPLYVARRMVVIASEDVGLADNSLLPLSTATYAAAEKIGMPECRINLAHCAVALCLAPKSTRAYRGLGAAYAALQEPGVAGLPVPIHLRNAPTRLMKELGYGKQYKYNPDFVDGRVVQDYLPEKLEGRRFLGSSNLGDRIDPEVVELDEQLRVAQWLDPDQNEVILNPDGD